MNETKEQLRDEIRKRDLEIESLKWRLDDMTEQRNVLSRELVKAFGTQKPILDCTPPILAAAKAYEEQLKFANALQAEQIAKLNGTSEMFVSEPVNYSEKKH
jgi:seryl-tRNA synthetase